MNRFEQLAAEAVERYHQLCEQRRVDPQRELAEVVFAHGVPAWMWMTARVWHVAHQQSRPKSRWQPTKAGQYAARTLQRPIVSRPAAALYLANVEAWVAIANTRFLADPELLAVLLDHPNRDVVAAAAANDRTPVGALRLDPRPEVRRALAGNPNLPVGVLVMLAGDPDGLVRAGVIRHPRTPAEVLEHLVVDESPTVRGLYAARKRTSARLLARLAADEDATVRFAVAIAPGASAATLRRLARDPDPDVAREATKRAA